MSNMSETNVKGSVKKVEESDVDDDSCEKPKEIINRYTIDMIA